MGLLEQLFSNGSYFHREAELLIDIELDNGESMKAGEIGSVMFKNNDGTYHFEHNDFACRVAENEIRIIEKDW